MSWNRSGALVCALGAAGLLGLALTGAKNNCLPVAEGCVEHDDCAEGQYCDAGACEPLGYCDVAEDCEGQPLPVPACVGFFTCEAHACVWRCGTVPLPCDPAAWRDCGDAAVCVAEALPGPGTCGPFAHGQTVGAGYACGGSIGVGCAEGLHCKGLPHGVTGGTGTCTLMTCADWYDEYAALVTFLRRCQTADECVPVPGTSCGCTRNLVLNRERDLTAFWDLVAAMNAAGCGIATTCDCPPADGTVCRDGLCAWNYVGY